MVITKMLIAVYYCMADYNIWRMTYMEMWDIYDANKEKTGRLMEKNDWQLKDGEYHLTVLGVTALLAYGQTRIVLSAG